MGRTGMVNEEISPLRFSHLAPGDTDEAGRQIETAPARGHVVLHSWQNQPHFLPFGCFAAHDCYYRAAFDLSVFWFKS